MPSIVLKFLFDSQLKLRLVTSRRSASGLTFPGLNFPPESSKSILGSTVFYSVRLFFFFLFFLFSFFFFSLRSALSFVVTAAVTSWRRQVSGDRCSCAGRFQTGATGNQAGVFKAGPKWSHLPGPNGKQETEVYRF